MNVNDKEFCKGCCCFCHWTFVCLSNTIFVSMTGFFLEFSRKAISAVKFSSFTMVHMMLE